MRHTLSEGQYVLGSFDTGDSVTVTLYNVSTGSSVSLTSGTASEIGSTGIFKWNTSDITTPPTAFTEYLWIMSNGTVEQRGKITIGGYPDLIPDLSDRLYINAYCPPVFFLPKSGTKTMMIWATFTDIEGNLVDPYGDISISIINMTNFTGLDVLVPMLKYSTGIYYHGYSSSYDGADIPVGVRIDYKKSASGNTHMEWLDTYFKSTDYEVDIDTIKKIQTGRWKMTGNQFIIYDDNGTTPLYTWDLKDAAGNGTMLNPYERTPV